MKRLGWCGLLGFGVVLLSAGPAGAAPRLRAQADQAGDFALIGNTLGQDCRGTGPAPVVGLLGGCGMNSSTLIDSAPDVFWRADHPEPGTAEASDAIAKDQARATATLVLPDGAAVTHAFLYWGAHNLMGVDATITLDREGGFSEEISALESWQVTINQGMADEAHFYQSVADVTAIVQAEGPGGYRVGGVDVVDVVDIDDTRTYAGFWMVVLYTAPGLPVRNLTLFDGLDRVSRSNGQDFVLEGLRAPAGGVDAKLGVVGYEGDATILGDRLFINPASATPAPEEALSDALNPPDNFFNGSRSWLGAAVSVTGDLPQLAGLPQSMPGVDIDVLDVTPWLTPGSTSIRVVATADDISGEAELYLLGGWVSSIGPGPAAYLSGSGVFGSCAAAPPPLGGGSAWPIAAALGVVLEARRRLRRDRRIS